MLNKIAKVVLVSTSLSPVFLTLAYVEYDKGRVWPEAFLYISTAVLLAGICLKIISLASTHLEVSKFSIKSAKSADKEVAGFFLAYLLPIFISKSIHFDVAAIVSFIGLFAIVVWGTHSYHFNPLLGLVGYHFYEVTADDGITYVLITRRHIVDVKKVQSVIQLTEYMVLEKN